MHTNTELFTKLHKLGNSHDFSTFILFASVNTEVIHISLSHCDRAVMAAVADCPVGCDVEAITTDTAAAMSQTIDYCFSPRERRAILQASDPEVEFIKIWTVKEAVFKLDNDIDIETLDTTALSRRFNIKSTVTPAFISTVATLNSKIHPKDVT